MGNGTEPGLTFPTSLGLWCYVEMTSQFPHCSSTAAANILDSLFPDNPSEQDKFKYFSPLVSTYTDHKRSLSSADTDRSLATHSKQGRRSEAGLSPGGRWTNIPRLQPVSIRVAWDLASPPAPLLLPGMPICPYTLPVPREPTVNSPG